MYYNDKIFFLYEQWIYYKLWLGGTYTSLTQKIKFHHKMSSLVQHHTYTIKINNLLIYSDSFLISILMSDQLNINFVSLLIAPLYLFHYCTWIIVFDFRRLKDELTISIHVNRLRRIWEIPKPNGKANGVLMQLASIPRR